MALYVLLKKETSLLKGELGKEFKLVTPGDFATVCRRWCWPGKRIMKEAPVQAIQAGSDYLVIGRPITQIRSCCVHWILTAH